MRSEKRLSRRAGEDSPSVKGRCRRSRQRGTASVEVLPPRSLHSPHGYQILPPSDEGGVTVGDGGREKQRRNGSFVISPSVLADARTAPSSEGAKVKKTEGEKKVSHGSLRTPTPTTRRKSVATRRDRRPRRSYKNGGTKAPPYVPPPIPHKPLASPLGERWHAKRDGEGCSYSSPASPHGRQIAAPTTHRKIVATSLPPSDEGGVTVGDGGREKFCIRGTARVCRRSAPLQGGNSAAKRMDFPLKRTKIVKMYLIFV